MIAMLPLVLFFFCTKRYNTSCLQYFMPTHTIIAWLPNLTKRWARPTNMRNTTMCGVKPLTQYSNDISLHLSDIPTRFLYQ